LLLGSTEMRKQKLKNDKFQENINKRGQVSSSLQKRDDSSPVGPIVLGFFLFVVVGSALLQVLRAAT